jgi:hypothetical protein
MNNNDPFATWDQFKLHANIAKEHGLLAEVMMEFFKINKIDADTVGNTMSQALMEWDM